MFSVVPDFDLPGPFMFLFLKSCVRIFLNYVSFDLNSLPRGPVE